MVKAIFALVIGVLIAGTFLYFDFKEIPELEAPVKVVEAFITPDGGTQGIRFVGNNGQQFAVSAVASLSTDTFRVFYIKRLFSFDVPYYVAKDSLDKAELIIALRGYTVDVEESLKEFVESFILKMEKN